MIGLLQPSPSDANLRISGDPLGMISEGSYDLNRFQYYPFGRKLNIWNRTDDIFNHTLSTGGYNNGGVTIYPNKIINLSQNAGGINTFPTKSRTQYIGDEVSNNPVPVVNALINAPVYPTVNQLVDKPLPPQINPIASR